MGKHCVDCKVGGVQCETCKKRQIEAKIVYNRNYRNTHIDQIKENAKAKGGEIVHCDACNCDYTRAYFWLHSKTLKHIAALR